MMTRMKTLSINYGLVTHPDHNEGILDEKVEEQRDEAGKPG